MRNFTSACINEMTSKRFDGKKRESGVARANHKISIIFIWSYMAFVEQSQTFPTFLMTDANTPSLDLVGLVSLLFVFIALRGIAVPFA